MSIKFCKLIKRIALFWVSESLQRHRDKPSIRVSFMLSAYSRLRLILVSPAHRFHSFAEIL